MSSNKNVGEVARLFLKLGCTAFGGPAAHISLMQEEVVTKRNWMSQQHFLDLLGATNLIPGPNSTEMAIHIGRERAGVKGLMVAGLCFILPAVIITALFAWLYKQYGHLPDVQPFVYGITPAIIAVVLAAIYPLGKASVKSAELAILGAGVLILALFHVNEIFLLFGAGIIGLLLEVVRRHRTLNAIVPLAFLLPDTSLGSSTNIGLFWIFLKIGGILYGSGYVLFAFLDTELVSTGLLSQQTLIDAIAVGQFTPGPVFSSVTFIGYQINGWSEAVVSTAAIFLPSFVFVALLNPLVRMMRGWVLFAAFLDAVNVASVAVIVVVCFTMARGSIHDWRTILIALLSIIITFGFRSINTAWVVLGGALSGYLLSLTG